MQLEIGRLHAFSDILVRLIANRDTGYPRRLTSFQPRFGEICAMQIDIPVARHYCNMGGRTAQCRNCLLYLHGSFLGERQFTLQRQIGEAYATEQQRQIGETFWVCIFSDCIGS